MKPEIIALQCPSCGSSETVDVHYAQFGHEFTCRHCKTISVLVINNKLYRCSPVERVCTACGRVAVSPTRYCQCGSSVVAQCISCLQEFPIDHQLCDSCGWRVGVNPESIDGQDLRTERAITNLTNHDDSIVSDAVNQLSCVIKPTPKSAEVVLKFYTERPTRSDALSILASMGSSGLDALVQLTRSGVPSADLIYALCKSIPDDDPTEAKLHLDNLLRKMAPDQTHRFLLPYYAIRFGEAAIPVLIDLLSRPEMANQASEGLEKAGERALPYLNRLTGFFAENELKTKARDIIKQINAKTVD